MSVDGGVAVAIAGVSHVSAWEQLGLKLKYAGDLHGGQGQKRKASETEGEDGDGEKGGISEDRSSKKERKRNNREPEHESPRGEEGLKKRGVNKSGEGWNQERGMGKDNMKTSGAKNANASLLDKVTSPHPALLAPHSPGSNNMTSSSSGSLSKSSLRKRTTEEKRLLRKSVTFTSDTKSTDGDSIKTLYQNYDPFAHYDSYQRHISSYPTNELPEGFDDIRPKFKSTGKHKRFDEEEGEKAHNHKESEQVGGGRKKRKMKAKKPKEQGESEKGAKKNTECKGGNVKPQLSYLLTHYTCREDWKFEKNKQNWILRNAFNLSMIPEEGYADALKSYIASVKGISAKERLLSEASEIMKHGKDTISKDGDKLNVTDQKNNVTRAKLVLAALGHGDDNKDEEDENDSSSSDGEK